MHERQVTPMRKGPRSLRHWLHLFHPKHTLAFAAVGVVSLAIDLLVLNAELHLHPISGGVLLVLYNTSSYGISWVFSYFGNRLVTFGTGHQIQRGSFWRFAGVSATGLLFNNVVLLLLLPRAAVLTAAVAQLSPTLLRGLGTQAGATLAKIAAGCLVGTWNFLASKLWAFRPVHTAKSTAVPTPAVTHNPAV